MPDINVKTSKWGAALVLGCAIMLSGCSTGWNGFRTSNDTSYNGASGADAAPVQGGQPSLVVTNTPADVVYQRGSRDSVLQRLAQASFNPFADSAAPVETLVTRKVRDLEKDLNRLKTAVAGQSDQLDALRRNNSADAAEYYEKFAEISARLQAGSTPGNPRLVEKWNVAQDKLNQLAQNTSLLSDLANDVGNEASQGAFLLESTRATFGLSGAVEEDHKMLTQVEDEVNELIVRIDRLLNQVNDEINRRTTYLRAERLNMQTLALAVANGELYGQSITNRLFSRAANTAGVATGTAALEDGAPSTAQRRPLVVIRFDRPQVDYEQAVYMAVSQALEKYPNAQFDLVAVSPSSGNSAQVALSASAAKKNGEDVLRSLTQMGLPMERIRLSAANSRGASSGEVHIYIR